ncbi:undecaprenyl/decaprenyl-phosphate alpha-N-acetylglucosaminyl 1-phosphate transferase [Candidatus Daviesbacteria bacterium]|nr:undecaprenyl/decaprenyl-phosphate alpha-N-acetylglucosaminyl 1-phosphate transferase [Candidatus Daviesbacteria bacterium]
MDFTLPALTAFIITVVATPLTIRLAKKFGLVDDPKTRPHPAHLHQVTIPRAGGLAIYLGLVSTILFFLPLDKHLAGILAGLTLLLIAGLIDDKLPNFNPYLRLFLTFLAAMLAVGSGIGISFITNPLAHFPNLPTFLSGSIIHLDQPHLTVNLLGQHNIAIIADILALFWIVALTQIVNWSKGVDGQMPGITTVAAIILGLLSLKFYWQGDPNQLMVAKLAFIVAGVSLAFLIFNWHPAKIFPGFSGSTILAYILAILAILSGAKLATALLVLAVPAVDFVYTFWRRLLAGKSPVWGDRGHLHHKLVDLGWSHQKISLFYITGSAMLGAIALAVGTESKIFTAVLVVVIFTGFVLWFNSLGDLSKP